MIYFIQSIDGGPVKIGTSSRLSQRLKQFATGHSKALKILAVLQGDRDVERALHDRFGHLRTVGEWFEPGADLMAFIDSRGKPWDGVDDVPSILTTIRSVPSWKEWLARFAVHTRKDLADVVDEALLRYARAEGFELPPKR